MVLIVIVFAASLGFSIIVSRQRQQIERLIEETAILSAELRDLRDEIDRRDSPARAAGAPGVDVRGAGPSGVDVRGAGAPGLDVRGAGPPGLDVRGAGAPGLDDEPRRTA